MTDNPKEQRGHDEARWIAFTQIAGWNVTLREGVTGNDIDHMIKCIEYASQQGSELATRIHVPEQTQSPSPSPQANAATRNTASASPVQRKPDETAPRPSVRVGGNDANMNPRPISKVVVTGTKAKPIVDLYSPNQKLKFPVFKVPADILRDILEVRYPSTDGWNLDQFSDVGEEYSVDWDVTWVQSPKDERWKDLVDIVAKDWEQQA